MQQVALLFCRFSDQSFETEKKKKKTPQHRCISGALGQSCCVFYRKLNLARGWGGRGRGGVFKEEEESDWTDLFLTIRHGRLTMLICGSD